MLQAAKLDGKRVCLHQVCLWHKGWTGGGYRERNVIQHIFRGTRLYDSDPVDMTQLALSFVLTCFIFLVHFWKIMEDLNGKFD